MLLLQQFSLQGAMVGARSNSLLYIFKKPVSGTIIFMDFYPGDCGVVDCSFCLRMELYGNQLGLYRLYIHKKLNTSVLSWAHRNQGVFGRIQLSRIASTSNNC